ncbi:MAG: MFS transporter [Acidobacteria bacterium]|nr:MAG: MFS transporter [Acidobacteriota bacterium]
MKRMTAAVAFMAVFTLAVCFIMIGSVSEELKARLGIGNAEIGSLILALSLTSIIVQVIVGPLIDRFGHKPVAVTGFLVSSGSVFLLAFAPDFRWALFASVLLGIGAICCNSVGNTLLPVVLFDGKEPARASNFGNGFVGLAFVLTPLLIVTLINDFGLSYPVTVSCLAVLVFSFSAFALLSSYPLVSTGFRLSKAVRLLREPAVLLAALALICYIGLEFTMNGWIKPLMTELLGGPSADNAVRDAGRTLALFGLAMAIGRFITSTFKNLTQIGPGLIAGLALVSVVLIVVLSGTGSPWIAALAVLLVGFAFAPMFPTIVGVTFAKVHPSLYGSVFGIIFSVGLLGPMVLPKLIGDASEGGSVQQSLRMAAAFAAVLVVVAVAIGRTGKGRVARK